MKQQEINFQGLWTLNPKGVNTGTLGLHYFTTSPINLPKGGAVMAVACILVGLIGLAFLKLNRIEIR